MDQQEQFLRLRYEQLPCVDSVDEEKFLAATVQDVRQLSAHQHMLAQQILAGLGGHQGVLDGRLPDAPAGIEDEDVFAPAPGCGFPGVLLPAQYHQLFAAAGHNGPSRNRPMNKVSQMK
jgi:hypothetical protein